MHMYLADRYLGVFKKFLDDVKGDLTLILDTELPNEHLATPGDLLPPVDSPRKPVFGLSLEQLFERDGTAAPLIVYRCIQAVDLFGLDLEGIYRLSGTQSHVDRMRAMFDTGISGIIN